MSAVARQHSKCAVKLSTGLRWINTNNPAHKLTLLLLNATLNQQLHWWKSTRAWMFRDKVWKFTLSFVGWFPSSVWFCSYSDISLAWTSSVTFGMRLARLLAYRMKRQRCRLSRARQSNHWRYNRKPDRHHERALMSNNGDKQTFPTSSVFSDVVSVCAEGQNMWKKLCLKTKLCMCGA